MSSLVNYPSARYYPCEKCGGPGESPLRLECVNDRYVLSCWWCETSGRETVLATYSPDDIVRCARLDPAEKDSRIHVWEFDRAPVLLQLLSKHGGDEDWLALLPPYWVELPFWMESGSGFGCCDTSTLELSNGWTIAIGAHA